MLHTIIIALAVAIAAFLVAWLFLKKQGSDQRAALNTAQTNLSVANDRLNNLMAESERLRQELTLMVGQREEAIAQLSAERARLEVLAKREEELRGQLEQKAKDVERGSAEYLAQRERAIELEKESKFLKEQLATQKAELEEIGKKFVSEFKLLADQVLEDKSKRFTDLNQTNMERLLKPLGENLTQFHKKVEEVYDRESKERFTLGKEIERLVGLNQKISDDAQNLTNALKGQVKQQGNWGEMILESILEKSGLVKGREYFLQESVKDNAGKRFQPDAIVEYPDKRKVVIDSKVSLVAYERYCTSSTPDEQKIALAQHVKSIRDNIDNLSSKDYQDLVGSLDFVAMFLPVEPAYMLAMQAEPDMWNYAYNKRVLLLSPTNLIVALKLIHNLWQREYQNRHALDIAERGGLLYDKFVNFVESLNTIGSGIRQADTAYGKAMGQLADGAGNLVSQAQKLKELGAKAKKSLPDSLLDEATDSDSLSLPNP